MTGEEWEWGGCLPRVGEVLGGPRQGEVFLSWAWGKRTLNREKAKTVRGKGGRGMDGGGKSRGKGDYKFSRKVSFGDWAWKN